MTNCKFYGFRRAVFATHQSKVLMKDCVVDLTMKGAYGDNCNADPVVSHLPTVEASQVGILCIS
jgi:hypothetical protein